MKRITNAECEQLIRHTKALINRLRTGDHFDKMDNYVDIPTINKMYAKNLKVWYYNKINGTLLRLHHFTKHVEHYSDIPIDTIGQLESVKSELNDLCTINKSENVMMKLLSDIIYYKEEV